METQSKNGTPATATQEGIPVRQKTNSEKFISAIEREFTQENGEISLTNFQKKLIQNYFINLDSVLKDAESRRLRKSEKYRDPLAYTWENVTLRRLAVDVVAFSAVGLDPTIDNHLSLIPYKSPTVKGKLDIEFMPGYKGLELKARKYGLDVPDNVIVELVYTNDHFVELKKDKDNTVESYQFKITNSFDRGDLMGGFYYHQFFNEPQKNKLKTFSKKDIDKRKPGHGSVDFWGGVKDNWVYDETSGRSKKEGTVEVEGWYDEMAYKTIYRAAYNRITIDSEKIDTNYMTVIKREQEWRDFRLNLDIKDNANKTEIGFSDDPPATKPVASEQKPAPEITKAPTAEREKENPPIFEKERQDPAPAPSKYSRVPFD